jgi:hypothetical protein
MSMFKYVRFAIAAVTLAACASSTENGAASADVTGAWKYAGVQTGGNRVTYSGTLTVTQQAGATFAGGLDAESSTPQGVITRVNAVVSGRVLGASAVDFDMQFNDGTRRHVGTIHGDSITGVWATGDQSATGTYTMARVR